jgi:hypothetical protein
VAGIVSEYGSTIADRPGKDDEPGLGHLPGTPGADTEQDWPQENAKAQARGLRK